VVNLPNWADALLTSDKPAAAVQTSIATLTNGGMGTVRTLSLSHQVDEYPSAIALLDVRQLERRKLAPARAHPKSTALPRC